MEKRIVSKNFSVDLAKKIDNGEVAGKIYLATGDGYKHPVDILTLDAISNRGLASEGSNNWHYVVVLAHFDNYDKAYEFNTDGYGEDEKGNEIELFIEVEEDVPVTPKYVYEFEDNPSKAIKAGCDINRIATKIILDGVVVKNRYGDVSQTPTRNIQPFKPFDKVLVRDRDDQVWHISLYESCGNDGFYVLHGIYYKQCIPYAGNEHLVGNNH